MKPKPFNTCVLVFLKILAEYFLLCEASGEITLSGETLSLASNNESFRFEDSLLTEIYNMYGTNDKVLNIDGFGELLSDLPMYSKLQVEADEQISRYKRASSFRAANITNVKKCYTQQELLDIFTIRFDNGLPRDVFMKICPALLVQLNDKICPHELAIEQATASSETLLTEIKGIPAVVWGYGIGSISAISICGLIAVGFIPCLPRTVLNTVLQFLVALAIGALSGDALLHLLPHSFGREISPAVTVSLKEQEYQGVYKGLCGLTGIYIFYLISRLQAILARMKDDRQKKREQMENIDYRHYTVTISDEEEAIEVLNEPGDKILEHGHKPHDGDEGFHDHGHEHDVPKSAKALAYRVIIGDGIHNFSDGLAVGVAFADSLIGGFSTSVAVFCHELPHEMGDFAVLLKKGMTAKQAICYNCLSSLLSMIGMLIGLAIGNVGEMSQWLFLGIAGMFLYISLVDLLPEINMIETESKMKHPLLNLLYQFSGIGLGIGIMLLIALYEEDLKVILGSVE